jgi:CHRD domain
VDKLKLGTLAAACAALTLGVSTPAASDSGRKDGDNDRKVAAKLSGYNEVHFSGAAPATLRGAVSSKARGTFHARIDDRGGMIEYTLSYEGLEGPVTQAHIHFGQRSTVGGIVVWLCQTAGTPAPAAVAGLTPLCPAAGTVRGTITPAQVLAATEQGIEAGAFDELVRAIRAGATYANVHTELFPPGEIRGQVDRSKRRDHDH